MGLVFCLQLAAYVGYCLSEASGSCEVAWRLPMTSVEADEIASSNAFLSSAALRVLTVAIRPLTAEDVETLKGCAGADERLSFVVQEPAKVSIEANGVAVLIDSRGIIVWSRRESL